MKLKDSIRYLKGIGEKRAELFHKLGVFTIHDLLLHLPRTYEDRTRICTVENLEEGDSVCVQVSLAGGIRNFRARNGAQVIQASVTDGTGVLKVMWFHAPYIKKTLQSAEEFVLFGKVNFRGFLPEMINPVLEVSDKAGNRTGKILPVYPCTAGLSQRDIRNAVQNALTLLSEPIPDAVPLCLQKKYHLMSEEEAIRQIHAPESLEHFCDARRRLAFEEFLILQTGIVAAKSQRKMGSAPCFENVKCIADFAKGLPFALTNAQKRVINEISADLRREIPMNRLVQGDVGSGKTVVAAAVMFAAVRSGFQAAMMAPTEILAKQHYENLKKLFAPWNITVAFLSGGQKQVERSENLQMIADGTAGVVVGTHALITDTVAFYRLGLAVTDEQHRFGVRQRTALSGKSDKIHTLVMTATPIPRTLSLILYGDLDISIIDELPAGRKKIETYAVGESKRSRVEQFVLNQMNSGRQAYFICPLVEESEVIEANAVDEYLKYMRSGAFRGRKIEALHGRMKTAEKEDVMNRFAKGEIEALVATTVIEVGVDVPNASVMVIENAERFGLSQLHQLRGRVGRGTWQSYCILFCSSGGSVARERMKIMCETEDGFKIAEKDLELRGPGEFLGTRQHGLPQMHAGDLMTDMQLLKEAQKAAEEVLERDPELKTPEMEELHRRVDENFEKAGRILN